MMAQTSRLAVMNAPHRRKEIINHFDREFKSSVGAVGLVFMMFFIDVLYANVYYTYVHNG